MDYFSDIRTAPEAFSALVARIAFYKSGALGMAFALVIKPLLGTPEFMGDLIRRNIVIRRCCRGRGRGGGCGTEDTSRANNGEPVPEFFCDEVCQGVEFFRGHG